MKSYFRAMVALCSFCLSLRAAEKERPRAAYKFAQVEIIKDIAQLSQTGKYAEIYKLLAPDYTAGMMEASFVGVLRNMSWKLENVNPGALEEYEEISYMPVSGDVVRAGRPTMKIDVVVFFKKTEAGWRLINFPFVAPDLPSFNSIPDWFLGNLKGLP